MIIPSPLEAEDRDDLLQDAPEIPWHISAHEMNYDHKADEYLATGQVVISKLDRQISADLIRFDHANMKAFAEGNVVMKIGEDILTGQTMEIDLDAQTGMVTGGSLYVKENNFHIRGDQIRKTGEETYEIDRAKITTCEGESPAWEISGSNVEVTIDGYGTVSHAALRLGNIPVLYSPYLIFPAKVSRQSGFLAPQIGESDRKGVSFILPYYWAINDHSDATFYEHFMSERGNKFGAEYRYALSPFTKGAVVFDFLDDRKTDDGIGNDSKDWGYEDDNAIRPNSDRYWFRMKHDQSLPWEMTGRLDIDVVSDQDYLTEFRNGYTGYEDTLDYFQETFGRNLDDHNDSVRVNRFNISRDWEHFNFNGTTLWYDDVIARRQSNVDYSLQQLPTMQFDAIMQPLWKTPLYYQVSSEYVYFYSEDNTNGHRLDMHPRIYWPVQFSDYLTVQPSAGYHQTAWFITDYDTVEKQKDDNEHRGTYDLRIDFTSEMSRVFRVDGDAVEKIQHWVRPRIGYEYIPEKNQAKYPSFNGLEDGINRIERQNRIVYSISNILTAKMKPGEDTGGRDFLGSFVEETTGSYLQFCRFKLEQSYDFYEADENNPAKWADGKHQRPFSPIFGEIDFAFNRHFRLHTDAEWSSYSGDFVSHTSKLRLADNRGDQWSIGHLYRESVSESFYTDLNVHLLYGFSCSLNYERNLREDRSVRTRMGLVYEAGCWEIDFFFTDEPNDQKFEIFLNLYGLGQVGL
jgi:LPS-assembly protein